eukprot:SAG11_NODE_4273_length_1973_cov_1.548559_4_plen_34_part_00
MFSHHVAGGAGALYDDEHLECRTIAEWCIANVF